MNTFLARLTTIALILLIAALLQLLGAASCLASGVPPGVTFGVADIGNGVRLHYAEEGHGTPVVFVHGSISDMSYWNGALNAFAPHYRAIAYSRRYNPPNRNAPIDGYSAIADADDLAAFVRVMHLHKILLVGHSYGAFVALFFALRHPDLLRAMVLAEPPAVSLLRELEPPHASEGRAAYRDIYRDMVIPMQRDFRAGAREQGVADFIDYVFDDPHRWASWSQADRDETMRDAHEWDVMMTRGTLFPRITAAQVRSIETPSLVISGEETYPFLRLIDDELAKLLPHAQYLRIPGVGHQMWMQRPLTCDENAEAFFRAVTEP